MKCPTCGHEVISASKLRMFCNDTCKSRHPRYAKLHRARALKWARAHRKTLKIKCKIVFTTSDGRRKYCGAACRRTGPGWMRCKYAAEWAK